MTEDANPQAPPAPSPREDAEEGDEEVIGQLVEALRPGMPILENAFVSGVPAEAQADEVIKGLPRSMLESLVDNDPEDVIEAVERINQSSPLLSAGGTRYIKAMFARIELALG